jgi:hypothetical protein
MAQKLSLVELNVKDFSMRMHGQTKLGFYPLPVAEIGRLRKCLVVAGQKAARKPAVPEQASLFG